MRAGSCRGGPILSASSVAEGPPGFRPSFPVPQPRRAPHPQNPNRDIRLLESCVTPRKQTSPHDSNRDKACVLNIAVALGHSAPQHPLNQFLIACKIIRNRRNPHITKDGGDF